LIWKTSSVFELIGQRSLMSTLIASIVGPVVALLLAWLLGNFLATRWDLIKKRTELDLSALEQFYQLYGEFFELWKVWDSKADTAGTEDRLTLLSRAASAEGRLESLFIRVAGQRVLSGEQIHRLGSFRQIYQYLRSAIKKNVSLRSTGGWSGSGDTTYAAFKGLAASIAVDLRPLRLSMRGDRNLPTASESVVSLRAITSNVYETWVRDNERLIVSEAVARNEGLLDIQDGPPSWESGSPFYNHDAIYPRD
jgi:hypothetical protein